MNFPFLSLELEKVISLSLSWPFDLSSVTEEWCLSNFQAISLWRSSLGNDQGETNRGLCDGMAQVQWRGV